MMSRIAFASVLVLVAATGAGAQTCQDTFGGRTVKPSSVDTVLARFAGLKPRGEFESTAEYETRITGAVRRIFGSADVPELIIGKAPDDRAEQITYDADAQTLNISRYAFSNRSLSLQGAFWDHPFAEQVGSWSRDVVVAQTDRATGAYTASNAFGAKATVSKIERRERVIFEEGSVGYGSHELFPGEEAILASVKVPPAEARVLKQTLRLAFVVRPKAPFYASNNYFAKEATIGDPREIRSRVSVLIADIRCGLVVNAAGKVLAAIDTR